MSRDDDESAYRMLTAIADPVFDAEWAAWAGHRELVALCDADAPLARLIYRVAGPDAIAWMDSKPPVLGGRSTPRQCLKSALGLKRLKSALVRYPYL